MILFLFFLVSILPFRALVGAVRPPVLDAGALLLRGIPLPGPVRGRGRERHHLHRHRRHRRPQPGAQDGLLPERQVPQRELRTLSG